MPEGQTTLVIGLVSTAPGTITEILDDPCPTAIPSPTPSTTARIAVSLL
jgi:hypothetical protein